MSDVDGRLEATRKALLETSIYFWAGFFIILISAGLILLGSIVSWVISIFGIILMLIGYVVIVGPRIQLTIKKIYENWDVRPDYEVITTHADGSKTSDGGAESKGHKETARAAVILISLTIGYFLPS